MSPGLYKEPLISPQLSPILLSSHYAYICLARYSGLVSMTCDRLSSGWLGGLGGLVGLAGYGGLVGCARSGTRTGIIIIITFISGVKCQLALLILELSVPSGTLHRSGFAWNTRTTLILKRDYEFELDFDCTFQSVTAFNQRYRSINPGLE